jgi:hypothetical protein
MNKIKREDYLALALKEIPFEDILERYDLDLFTVFNILYENGYIDEEILESEADTYHE